MRGKQTIFLFKALSVISELPALACHVLHDSRLWRVEGAQGSPGGPQRLTIHILKTLTG